MAKVAGKSANMAIATVALEGYIKNLSLDFTQELPNVTALSDLGPRVVDGNYDWKVSLDGDADFATSVVDATVYGCLGSTALKPLDFQPTGTTETTDTPCYLATDMRLASYSIKAAVGSAVTYAAAFQGNSSMQRATT